jgi:hypothetical protein
MVKRTATASEAEQRPAVDVSLIRGGNGAEAPSNDAADPFDPAALRLDQSFLQHQGAKKLLTEVPVRKPNRQEFVRVHPDDEYRLSPVAIIELKDEREFYLVLPSMAPDLPGEIDLAALFTAINRQGDLFLWPVKLPRSDGRRDRWRSSAMAGAELATSRWVRMSANMMAGLYDTYEAIGKLPDPTWPEYSFQKLLEVAFQGMIVDRHDHPVIRRLLGA